ASTQYLLAELYFFQLDKPDSAYQEFEYIIKNFPESYLAPKALIAMATIQRNYYSDTLAFDSMLRIVVQDYIRSDYAPEAIDLLGLSGTAVDTGYAKYYYHKAEKFAFDEENYDSAIHYFNYIADSFPHSNLNVKARFTSIWMNEEFANTGDSSLYYAYVDFVDSFPNTVYGKEADQKLLMQEGKVKKQADRAFDEEPYQEDKVDIVTPDSSTTPVSLLDENKIEYQEDRNFTDPDGNTIRAVEEGPVQRDLEFRYPPSAFLSGFYGDLVFQIKIDAFGYIEDLRLMNQTSSPELNRVAEEVVKAMKFSTGWMDPGENDNWFVYKYRVDKPAGM
ncbi:MAG: hypothetical protein GY865_14350, partial [candidate division Zixibacteria bacterium]|nr:hypothetical protein [candidate division Zixibacteria bacterium]